MSCLICSKHEGQHEGSKYFIFRNKILSIYHMFPEEGEKVYQGYVFLELNRHVGELDEMTFEEAEAIGSFQKILPEVLKDLHLIDHVYVFQFGDGVAHIHFHIIPRYEGAPREYRGTSVCDWKGAPFLDEVELLDYCKKLGRAVKTAYINYLADKKIAAGQDGEAGSEIESAEDRQVKTGGYENNDMFEDESSDWDDMDPLGDTPYPRWG